MILVLIEDRGLGQRAAGAVVRDFGCRESKVLTPLESWILGWGEGIETRRDEWLWGKKGGVQGNRCVRG